MLTFLKRKSSSLLGIDIGTTSIKILELSIKNGTCCVEEYAHKLLLPNHNDVDAIANCVKEMYSSAGFLSKKVILAVPDSCAISKVIQINSLVSEKDFEEWVLVEAENHIPFSLDDVSFDFRILGPAIHDSERLDVLIVASRAEHVEQRTEIIRRAGLIAHIVDVESYAIARAAHLCISALPFSNPEHHLAIFEIDKLSVRCFVFNRGTLIFSREDSLEGIFAFPECYALLLQLIKRLLQFFSATNHGVIGQIILAGIRAKLHGLKDYLESYLKRPIHIANPFKEMRFATKDIGERIEKDAPMLMVACGLALRR